MEDYVRLEDVLLSYWDRLRGNDKIPHEDEIDPSYLKRIWDDCFLALITDNRGYRYEYLGKNLMEAYGEDISLSDVENLISTSSHEAVVKFDEVISTKKPVTDSGEFTNTANMLIKYRQLLLPFVNHDEKVTYILGGMRWKIS